MKEKNLKLAIVTPEMVPFSKVGGLADVMGALPDEIERKGLEISIFTPLYSSIDRERFDIENTKLEGLKVPVSSVERPFDVYTAKKPGTDIDVFFIYSEEFYGREGIYTVPETGEAFDDEAERTIFFNRAVISAIKSMGIEPDVIHCNDFHSGLIPALLSIEEGGEERLGSAGTVFSIHNLAYQGYYDYDFMEKAGLDPSLFYPMSPFEFWGGVNVMKVGIRYSDIISTVSERYAEEITESEEYGHGLEGVLEERKDDLIGILNGIDEDAWNPVKDDLIAKPFSADDISGKEDNRIALLDEYGLKQDTGDPIIGMVSRLVDQKGFDILAESMNKIMKLRLKLVILGTGQEKYHELYGKLQKKYPKRLGVKLEYNNKIAHMIEAGSDFFLMPSRYEPCGLNQMYSLRYGTIPIVRATGGLADTISEISPKALKGNGFLFEDYSARALTATVKKAVKFFKNEGAVEKVRHRIMREDHSWKRSAGKYIEIYKKAAGANRLRLTTK